MAPEKYWVYVLRLDNDKNYTGCTNNLERRLAEHREKRSPYTSKYQIEKVLYSEGYATKSEAMKREKFLKSGKGRAWLKDKLAKQSYLDG